MANNGWTPLGKKVDLGRETQGTLPITSLDPLVQEDVTDGYNLGTSTDGLGVLEGKDASKQLAFFRLLPGTGMTIVQMGNSLQLNATVLAGSTPGVMLTSTYDVDGDGIVDVSWANIASKPISFPPSPHTHAESDITGLATDLAAKVPITRVITTAYSLEGGGPLNGDLTISLIGDVASVPPEMRYGTDASGNLGWYSASEGAGDMQKSVYDTNHNGIVDMATAVITGGVLTAMLGNGSVTGVKIASGTIPASALAPGVAAANLGYVPLNKAGDTASGRIVVNTPGPGAVSNMYQFSHFLAQTSGAGAGVPTIGFACLSGGANAGAVAMWYQGAHSDIQLEYGDGTAASLLSTLSPLNGAKINAGSIGAGSLAVGVSLANLGFTPINSAGGYYNTSSPLQLNKVPSPGISAASWSVAPLIISANDGGGSRPQIGFYYPGTAASLYFEPTDVTMRYVDSGGTVRVLWDNTHLNPVSKNGDTMSGALFGPEFVITSTGGYQWAIIAQNDGNLYAVRVNDNFVKRLAP